jgi:hypothetical protein
VQCSPVIDITRATMGKREILRQRGTAWNEQGLSTPIGAPMKQLS